MNDQVSHPLAMEFHRARLGAIGAAIDELIRHRPPSLLCSTDSPCKISVRERLDRGLKSVPIYQIASRAARYESLDRLLRPAHADGPIGCGHAAQTPIELYQVGETYFVKDGNRRVSDARTRGQLFLLAHVTEYLFDGALDDSAAIYAQLLRDERQEFHTLTEIAQIRPVQSIECSALGGYAELLRQIEWCRAALAARVGLPIERQIAAASWYDTLYEPITSALRHQHALEQLPDRCETDLYLWVTSLRARPAAEAAPPDDQRVMPLDALIPFIANLRCT